MNVRRLFVVLAACLVVAGGACGQALGWDGYVKVVAAPVEGGRWASCRPGLVFPFASVVEDLELVCGERKAFRFVTTERAHIGSLQEALDMYARPPAGARWSAVGALPVLLEGMTVNTVDPGMVFVAYRVVKN